MKAFCVLLLLLCLIEYSFATSVTHYPDVQKIVVTPDPEKTLDVLCRLPSLRVSFRYSASKVEIAENVMVITLTNNSVVVAPVQSCMINKDGK